MPKIQFRTKVQSPMYVDGTSAGRYVQVPDSKSIHCDMNEFRRHPAFSCYANSDMFPSIVRRALEKHGVGKKIDMSNVPPCVTIDETGF